MLTAFNSLHRLSCLRSAGHFIVMTN